MCIRDRSSYEASNEHLKKHPENDYVFPNGESFLQVLERLIDFLKDINTRYSGKKILIVSHGFPCETLLDWVSNKPLSNWDSCIEKISSLFIPKIHKE